MGFKCMFIRNRSEKAMYFLKRIIEFLFCIRYKDKFMNKTDLFLLL